MKTFQSLLLLLFLAFSLTNCSEDSSELELRNDQFQLESQLTVLNSTDQVSPLFFNAGIAKIDVEREGSTTTFTPLVSSYERIGHRVIRINNYDVVLSDYKVSLEKGFLHLNGNKTVTLSIKDDKPYIITADFSGYLEDNNALLQNKEVAVLLVFLEELTLPVENKVVFDIAIRELDDNYRACSFWDTYYSVGFGFNKSAAYANFEVALLDDLTDGGMGANCTAIGPPEYHNYGVVHYYTMAFCCP